MLDNANWNYPTQIYFGVDRIKDIGTICQSINISKALIVTDSFLTELDFFTTLQSELAAKDINTALFTDFKGNPSDTDIDNGILSFCKHQPDGIIAIGGGSALDVGKTIALVAKQALPLWEFEDVGDNYLKANANLIPPIIAIPTTAGTGSEVGRAAVIKDTTADNKKIIFHPKMLPAAVILDPLTTLSVPKDLTATTGMDAFAHNLEAFLAPGFHPMADGIALEGLRLIKDNILVAYNEPQNIEARANLLVASTMGATAFQKGLGLIHSLSHPVGAIYNLHHGLLNAVFMPYALLFNQSHIEQKCTTLAKYLNLEEHSFQGLLNFILSLIQSLNIPLNLAELGVGLDKVDEVANKALNDPSTSTNAKDLDIESLKTVYANAIDGNLTIFK